jgi:cysteine-rich repeat protein
MRTFRSSALVAAVLVAGCYNPSEEPETASAPTTGGPGADDGGSTGTSPGMTSTSADGADDATSVDPPTTGSTMAVDDSSGDDTASTMTPGESSESGPIPTVCGDGVLEGDEQCDDENLEDGDFCAGDCTIETRVFSFTGMSQSFDVPAWATAIVVEAWGAQGGGAECCKSIDDDGGRGGHVIGTLAVTPGETVAVFVGGQGTTAGTGGWNGGGFGGQYGAGGGGASDVRIGGQAVANRVLVAGGGGGGNCGCPDHGAGGPGGGLTGGAGVSLNGLLAPGGGTQTAGGTAGDPPGMAGGPGVGGSFSSDGYHVAGGGGGWFGGGSAFAAGGGGGSSYLGDASESSTQPDEREGDGEIRVTPVIR